MELLTTKNVADELRVGIKKVRQLIADEQLEAIDVDPSGGRRTYRVSRAALNDFLRRNQMTSDSVQKRRQRQRGVPTYEFIK